MTKTLLAGAITLALSVPASAAAVIPMSPFETGMDGFTQITPATTGRLMSYTAATSGHVWTPCHGAWFGYAQAGLGTNVTSTLTKTIHMTAGQKAVGCWGFQAEDYLPFDDTGYLKVFNELIGSVTLLQSSVAAVGDYGHTGWIHWSFMAPHTGTYTFEIGVENINDNVLNSLVFLDAKVPEPGTWAMLIAGFGLVGWAARRRRVAVAA